MLIVFCYHVGFHEAIPTGVTIQNIQHPDFGKHMYNVVSMKSIGTAMVTKAQAVKAAATPG